MKTLPVLFLLLFAHPAFSQNSPSSPEIEQRIKNITGHLQMETSIKDSFINRTLSDQLSFYHTPGIAIAVINDGKIEWVRGFGYADVAERRKVDTNTLFQAASISKPTTTTAVMKLYEQQKISLDSNINNYLESWQVPFVGEWQPAITLRQLLSHTAGLTVHGFPGYQTSEKIPTAVQVVGGSVPANTNAVVVNLLPGTKFRYSGGGTTVAQLVLTDHFKMSFPDLMQETLFTPLHMRHSTFAQPLPTNMQRYAATAYPSKGIALKGRYHVYPEMAPAGLWTTPADLATLFIEVQKALDGKSNFITRETATEMLKPQPAAPFIGLGFFLEGDSADKRFSHSGWNEGFVCKAVAYKQGGKGAVVMINSNEGSALLDEVINAIAKEYEWPGYKPKPVSYLDISATETDSLTGNYVAENGLSVTVSYSDKKLWLGLPNQSPVPLSKTDKRQYLHPLMKFTIRFNQKELLLDQEGQVITFKKK